MCFQMVSLRFLLFSMCFLMVSLRFLHAFRHASIYGFVFRRLKGDPLWRVNLRSRFPKIDVDMKINITPQWMKRNSWRTKQRPSSRRGGNTKKNNEMRKGFALFQLHGPIIEWRLGWHMGRKLISIYGGLRPLQSTVAFWYVKRKLCSFNVLDAIWPA